MHSESVHPDIHQAETLPARAFLSSDWHKDELSRVFGACWAAVPWRSDADDGRTLVDLLVRRGSQLPVTVNEAPLILQRDWKGTLRAFPNVCTHAWHTLVDGYGRQRSIVCPQHGRRFDTEGKVLSHPGLESNPRFPRPCDHLQAWEADMWRPFVFVRRHPGGPSLSNVLQPLADSTALLPWDQARRTLAGSEVRQVAGNWKLHVWNFLDHFHVGHIHKAPNGLADAIELANYRTELYEDSVLQWVWARRPEDGFAPHLLPDRFAGPQRVYALWWFIFPNLALNLYPWGISINLFGPAPDPERSLFHWYRLVWDEALYAEVEGRWHLGQVDAEDVEALRQVQRGLASGLVGRGLFAPGQEAAAHWFHHKVSALMPA